MIVVHAGNRVDTADREPARFPPSRTPHVGQRLRALLDVLQPAGVVTAAAAGADLLMAEAAILSAVPLHLVLPFERGRFRKESVSDRGEPWDEIFDRVIGHVAEHRVCSLVELDLEPSDAGFRAGNGALVQRALELDPRRVLVVAVRPPATLAAPSITDDFVEQAAAAGLFVIEIDPSP